MPQRPIDPRWVSKVIEHLAQMEEQHQRLSDKRVYEALEQDAETWRKSNDPKLQHLAKLIPSTRSISRIRADKYPKLPEEERAQYRMFRWPESMESGLLPWEASRPLLDFIERRGRSYEAGTERPTNRLAKWFWRLYQVAQPAAVYEMESNDGLSELDRVEVMARQIAEHETSEGVPAYTLRAVEGWLACHGWTEEGATHYHYRVSQGVYPYL